MFYLTCPRARSAIGRLEASGLMREMTARLGTDDELAAAYRAAHEDYLARRERSRRSAGRGVSAGGMPHRVKCLHVLVAHALAAGPGVNPFGDEALALLSGWGAERPVRDRADHRARRRHDAGCGTRLRHELVAVARRRDVATGRRCGTSSGEMEIVRLGEGVDRTGRLSDGRLGRTFGVLDDYAAVIRSLDVEPVRMVATSATRDAANRDGVRGRWSAPARRRARRSSPARRKPRCRSTARPRARTPLDARRLLVVDIGGGSTEFVRATRRAAVLAVSVDVGCVRLTERHLRDDPPTAGQVAARSGGRRGGHRPGRGGGADSPALALGRVAGR